MASIKEVLSYQPEELIQLIKEVQSNIRKGKKINNLRLMKNWLLISKFIDYKTPSSLIMKVAKKQSGIVYKWKSYSDLSNILRSRPSIDNLEELASTLKADLGPYNKNRYQFAYSTFIRGIHSIGKGSYGKVMVARLSSPKDDEELLDVLIKIYSNLGDTEPDNAAYIKEIVKTISKRPHFALKYIRTEIEDGKIEKTTDDIGQELLVGQQMNEVIQLIHIFAYQYAISFCSGVTQGINAYKEEFYLTPCYTYGMNNEAFLYSEFIPGKTLGNNLSDMTEIDLLGTLAVIHSTLAYLWKRYRFTHGDLTTANIIMRSSIEPFDIPILSEDGKVLYYVRLNWHPVIIDLGMACTAEHSTWGLTGTPYTTPFNDITRLYSGILHKVPSLADKEPFKYYLKEFNKIFTREDITSEEIDNKTLYTAPVGLNISSLTHSSMLKIIEKTNQYDIIKVTDPIFYSDMRYKPIAEESAEQNRIETHDENLRLLAKKELELSILVGKRKDSLSIIVLQYLKTLKYSMENES